MKSRLWPPRFLAVAIVAVLATSLGVAVAPARAAGGASTLAADLVWLFNGERAHAGLPALRIDPFLTTKAMDGDVVCPNDASLVAHGRSQDHAVYGWVGNPHYLRLCPTYSVLDAMFAWDYLGTNGEISAFNGGYDENPFPYQFGCDVHQENCGGTTTTAPTAVAIASYGFMTSQGHRDQVMSASYDRIGCGVWVATSGDHYFDCMFSNTGPNETIDPPSSMTFPAPSPSPTPSPSPPPPASPSPSSSLSPDITRPRISSRSPLANAVGVDRDGNVRIFLSERVRGVSSKTVRLVNSYGQTLSATVRYDATRRLIVLNPLYRLRAYRTFRLDIRSGITDLSGNSLAASRWYFRTGRY